MEIGKVGPLVGEFWSNEDPRLKGRVFEILAVQGDKSEWVNDAWVPRNTARIKVVRDREGAVKSSVGRTFFIHLSRFKPGRNGYRLVGAPVSDAE